MDLGVFSGDKNPIRSISDSQPAPAEFMRNLENLLVRSQFWSVSGSKNNTKKESDPLSAPKCRQEVYRRDILSQLDSIRDTFTDLRWNFASPWQLVGIAQFEQSKSSLSLRNVKPK